ncbi:MULTISPECIES: heme-binding protein [Actinomycetes]|uniref:GlcG/HbpS family heme-binding protein n=1 Tax=Actinomycetes TaxID=1760 RepID=UPI001F1F194D|nr:MULTISPECIES: heme-binding protein [Actinomycetes]
MAGLKRPDYLWISILIDVAKAEARDLGVALSFAVVDADAHLLYFERQPEAPLFSCALSQDKAFTAARTGRSTADWSDLLEDCLVLPGDATTVERFLPLPGGEPIALSGRTMGALGVAGGTSRQDAAVALSAVSSLKVLDDGA